MERISKPWQIQTTKIKIFENEWKSGVEDEFSNNFADENISEIQTKIENIRENDITQNVMNELSKMLSDMFIQTAQSVGLYKEGGKKKRGI